MYRLNQQNNISIKLIGRAIVILTILPAVYFALNPGKIVITTIICCYLLLLILLTLKIKDVERFDSKELVIRLFFWYGIVTFFRGVITAVTYQDWTTILSSGVSMFVFMPLMIYFGKSTYTLYNILKSFLLIGVPLCFLIFYLSDDPGPHGFTHVIAPIYLFILLVPYVKKSIKFFIFSVTIFSFFSDITIRANMVNILMAILILSTYFIRLKSGFFGLIKTVRFVFLSLPLIFLTLGFFGLFNVFAFGDALEQYEISDSSGKTQNIFIDSRSSIYNDVFSALEKENAYFFGLGATGKTETQLSKVIYADFDKVYKEGRRGTESGMLNYLQFGGILGGFFYFLLMARASYLAVYRSNNWLLVSVGIWNAFKFMFSFIEDPSVFTIATVFNFICIGICFNKQLREMNDLEIKTKVLDHLLPKLSFN